MMNRMVEFIEDAKLNNREKYYGDIVMDGDIGAKTMQAFKSYYGIRNAEGLRVLAAMLQALQMSHYITLAEKREKDERFVYGWAVRAMKEAG